MASNKHAFWQALVFTIIVFAIGILLGFFLEGSRSDSLQLILLNSEISLVDQQVRANGIGNFYVDCDLAKGSTLQFADDIYEEARLLETYDSRAKLEDTLKILHKRYDLLRMMLWTESIDYKKKCGNDMHTVVYLYEYSSSDVETQARQASLSRLLLDLKSAHGSDILLIPIAANLNLSSVDLVADRYGIEKFPVIIIDENKLVKDAVTLSELESVVFEEENMDQLENYVYQNVNLEQKNVIFQASNE